MIHMLESEQDILDSIKQDPKMMAIIRTTKKLDLPDCWVSAGFVRSKIWDVQHGFDIRRNIPDIDVIYFDSNDTRESTEKLYEAKLQDWMPDVPWSVKNQARMHELNGFAPFTSTLEGITHFPETVTALGVRETDTGEVELAAPWGIEDVVEMIVRPTIFYTKSPELRQVYINRMKEKNWPAIWPKVCIGPINEVTL